MNSAYATHVDDEDDDQEPAVLSYTQFRNHLGLLDWRRRRQEYEQHLVGQSAANQPRNRQPAPGR